MPRPNSPVQYFFSQVWQRWPVVSLLIFVVLVAAITAVFTPQFIARLSSQTLPVLIAPAGTSSQTLSGLGLQGTLSAWWTTLGAIVSVFRLFWIPWGLTVVFVGLIAQYFIAQHYVIPWFYLTLVSTGLACFALMVSFFSAAAFDLVLPLIGFPTGMTTIALGYELKNRGLAWGWSFLTIFLAMFLGVGLGVGLIHWLLGIRWVGL